MDTVSAGGIPDLFRVYSGLDSGRIVVLGDPGTGKSAAAVLTVLDALKHRQGLDDQQRAKVPVPVLLTAHGWDPNSQRLDDWLANRLNAEYFFLRSGNFGQDVAARLVEDGLIALVLDGFDEISDDLRPLALRAMDQQAMFRMMVLTRTSELVDAVASGHLHGAAALELLPVPPSEAANYLMRTQVQPTPPAWQRLVEHLQDVPHSAVSRALDNPLMLTLVRDTFPTPVELGELLAPDRFANREEVEVYLLSRVIVAAYRPRPGQSVRSYSFDQASRWLSYIAAEMSHRNTRDLAWWQIRRWPPARLRAIPNAVLSSAGFGLTVGAAMGIPFGATTGVMSGLTAGIANGITVGTLVELQEQRRSAASRLPSTSRGITNSGGSLRIGLVSGFPSGLAAGIAVGLAVELGLVQATLLAAVATLAFGIACGSTEAILQVRRNAGLRYLRQPAWSGILSKESMVVAVAFGAVFGLVVGIAMGIINGPMAGLVAGLAIGPVTGLVLGVLNGLVQPSAHTVSPMDPITSWRRDRQSGIIEGVIYGFCAALAFGLVSGIVNGVETGLSVGLPIGLGLGVGIMFGFAASQSWLAMFGFLMMRCAGLFPFRGMRFLEDAHSRGVLRTVGSVYQFRHARLQDQLASLNLRERDVRGALMSPPSR